MSQLSSTPAQQVSVLLERAKSFSLGVRYVTADHRAIDITGSTTLLKVIEQPQFGSGVVLTATAEADGDPIEGNVRFDLQATDLDLTPRIYLFVIVMHAASGYSGVVAKGEIEIFANGETESLALTYPGVNPSQILEVALGDNNSITLSVPSFEYPELLMGGVTTLSPGSDAIAQITGRYPTQILTLSIPRGATGASGVGIADMAVTSGRLFITLTSGTVLDAGPMPVADGGTAAPTESPAFTGSPTVNGDPIATTTYVDDGDADTLAAAVAADDILEADYIARDAAVAAAADAANDALEADYIARDAAVAAAADAANDALEADYIARDAVLAADIATRSPSGHSHGASGMTSTVSAGLPTVTGRTQGDQHYNQTDGKEYVLTGAAASTVASDDFTGKAGTLNGQTTSVGGLTYIASGSVVCGSDRVTGGGMVEVLLSGGGSQSASITSYVVSNTSAHAVYLKTSGASVSTSGYDCRYQRNTGSGTAQLRILRLGTQVALYSLGASGSQPVAPIRLHGSFDASTGTVTATIEGGPSVSYVDPSPLAGNYAGFLAGSASTGTDYSDDFSAGSPDTRAWISTDDHLPTHTHTPSARTTAASVNTAASGLPSLLGRLTGDQHLDTTTGRPYVYTGTAGASAIDTFARTVTPGASLGSITLSGTAYPYFHSGSSTGVGVNGDRVYQNGSSSAFYPVTHNTPGSTTQGVSLAVETVENGNSNCGLYARGAASHSGTSSKGTGYMALLTGANANPKVELWRNGVLVATGATASGYAISGSKPAKITLQVIGDTVTFGIMNPLTNTVVTNDAYVDASPIAGSYYGFVVGWYGQVDNYEIGLAGTATWTRSTPLHLTGTIPGAAAVLTHAIKPGIRVPEATTARSIVVRADTAPSGGSYTVTLERWNNGSFVNNVGAVTLTTGVSVNSATGLAVALAGGDILRANVSASSGAADVLISVDCWS